MSALVWRGFSEWKKTKSGSHLVGRRWHGIWRRILEASLYCPEEVFTWSPYSCSDLAALCWVHTSRQPLGSFCSSSEQFCCTLAAFRWSLWTAPGGTRRQDVITNVLSYLHQFHRSAESVLCLTKGMATGQLLFVMRSRLSNCRLLVTVSCMITLPGSPSSRWQRLCHSPPWSRAASPPGSTWRRDEKWADRSRSQPVQRDEGDQGFKKALFCHTESSTAHPWNKQIFCQVCIVTEGQWLFQKNNNISPVLQTLND